MNWIEVKDRYPDTNGRYLVVVHGYTKHPYIILAKFLTNLCDNPQFEYENYPEEPGFYECDGEGDWVIGDVTHWMTLPSLPKKENKDD